MGRRREEGEWGAKARKGREPVRKGEGAELGYLSSGPRVPSYAAVSRHKSPGKMTFPSAKDATGLHIGQESVPIQLAQCRFPGLAMCNAKM